MDDYSFIMVQGSHNCVGSCFIGDLFLFAMVHDLKRMVERGDISLRSAAYKLYRMGRVKFLPSDREVIKLLHIII